MKANLRQILHQMRLKLFKSNVATTNAPLVALPNSDQLTKNGFLKRKTQAIYKSRSKAVKFSAGKGPVLKRMDLVKNNYSLISTPASESKNILPENSWGETSFNNLARADSNFESAGGWTLNTTMPANLGDPSVPKPAKSLSLVSKTQDSLSAKANTDPFFNPLGETKSKNLSLAGFPVKGDIADSFYLLGGKMESGFDSAGGQGGKSSVNVSGSLTNFQQLQDLPNHNSGALKNGLAMTNLGINDNFGENSLDSHNMNYNETPQKVNGKWTKVPIMTRMDLVNIYL